MQTCLHCKTFTCMHCQGSQKSFHQQSSRCFYRVLGLRLWSEHQSFQLTTYHVNADFLPLTHSGFLRSVIYWYSNAELQNHETTASWSCSCSLSYELQLKIWQSVLDTQEICNTLWLLASFRLSTPQQWDSSSGTTLIWDPLNYIQMCSDSRSLHQIKVEIKFFIVAFACRRWQAVAHEDTISPFEEASFINFNTSLTLTSITMGDLTFAEWHGKRASDTTKYCTLVPLCHWSALLCLLSSRLYYAALACLGSWFHKRKLNLKFL